LRACRFRSRYGSRSNNGSKHRSELTEGQIDREEKFRFEAAHVNAMTAVVEAEAVTRRAGPARLAHVAGGFRSSHR
jgi:hypothetical protein